MRNLPSPILVNSPATLRADATGSSLRLVAGGEWTVPEAPRMDTALRAIGFTGIREAEIDANAVTMLDSSGAWLFVRAAHEIQASGCRLVRFAVPERFRPLIEAISGIEVEGRGAMHPASPRFGRSVERLGRATVEVLRQGYDLVEFLGRVTVETGEAILAPRRELPLPAFFQQIEETGLTALPIVGLLAFLLGVVLTYQGADQLKRFGAEVYTIDFLAIGFMREIGGLVTAIIVAGRSGSAFTAQIGTMRVNEETDAMRTIGLNTTEILVVPRVLGLMIALPLLTFFADVVGIIGGMVMTYFDLGITFPAFLRELEGAITLKTLMVGLVKAPVFAFVIALVGCFEGMRVERNAASVGRLTTRSVVESIFLIIALDAGFSVLFSMLGI